MSADKEYTAREHLGLLIESLTETFDLASPMRRRTREAKKLPLGPHRESRSVEFRRP